MSDQGQYSRYHTQTVIRFRYDQTPGDACGFTTGEHQSRVRRDAKERPVVPAGIRTAHIEVPMIFGHYQHSGFDQSSLTPAKTAEQPLVCRKAGRIYIRSRGREERELFV